MNLSDTSLSPAIGQVLYLALEFWTHILVKTAFFSAHTKGLVFINQL